MCRCDLHAWSLGASRLAAHPPSKEVNAEAARRPGICPGPLAWISTDRNWPHKTPSRMPIFRVLSHRCCDAKWYADNPIALRLLAHRLCDSGHFRDPRGEKRLRTGVYQHTDLANGHRRILESCESLSDLDVRAISLRGNPA